MADFWGGDVSFEPTKLIVTADSGLDGSNLGALCLPDYAVHTASLAVLHNLNLSCLVRRTCKTYADLVYPPSTIRIFSNNGIEWMPLLLKYDCGLLVCWLAPIGPIMAVIAAHLMPGGKRLRAAIINVEGSRCAGL